MYTPAATATKGDTSNTCVHKSIHVPVVRVCVDGFAFFSCGGFYWVCGSCNCNFKVAAAPAAHIAVAVAVCSVHFKKA